MSYNTITESGQADFYNENQFGENVGRATRQTLMMTYPIVGLAMEGGHLVNQLMPRDQYGDYKNDFVAHVGSALDPFESWGAGLDNIKNGHVGKGLAELLIPGLSGPLIRRDHAKKLKDLGDKNFTSIEVGDYNNLAGKVSGQSTGTKESIHEFNIVPKYDKNTNVAFGKRDAMELISTAASGVGAAKAGKLGSFGNKAANAGTAGQEITATPDNVDVADLSGIKDPAVKATTADVLGVQSDVQNPLSVGASQQETGLVSAFDKGKMDNILNQWSSEYGGANYTNVNQMESSGFFNALDPAFMNQPQSKDGLLSTALKGQSPSKNLFSWDNEYSNDSQKKKVQKEHLNEYQNEGLIVGYPMLLGQESYYQNY